jgi:hypothetical protein
MGWETRGADFSSLSTKSLYYSGPLWSLETVKPLAKSIHTDKSKIDALGSLTFRDHGPPISLRFTRAPEDRPGISLNLLHALKVPMMLSNRGSGIFLFDVPFC